MATKPKTDGNEGLWVAAAIVGFFAVPMLAEASPLLVNGFLLLVLFSSLLLNSDRWLPYLVQLEAGADSGGTGRKERR